ncbi:MAG: Lrp/AsnC family transcriptional regulator, partial [Thermoprotei archaeon]|nr:Lrp/AsnC family transcriptional regulator [Thermoprotei archaeon]
MLVMVYVLGDWEIEVLMRLQYEFPLSPTPFVDVAEGAGLSFEDLSSILRDLARRKILKRVGFYYNYRAQGHVAALVAFSCRGRYEALAEALRRDSLVTHSFLRDHPVYDVWAVIKRGSKEELLDYVRGLAFKGDVGGWVAL